MISAEEFEKRLCSQLGNRWKEALAVFHRCGQNLSEYVVEMIEHAIAQGKLSSVLCRLEEHYEARLRYQPPDVRGLLADASRENPTAVLFATIYREILCIPITWEEE